MSEAAQASALLAGLATGLAILAAGWRTPVAAAAAWLGRSPAEAGRPPAAQRVPGARADRGRAWLERRCHRAGLEGGARRLLGLAGVLAVGLGALGASLGYTFAGGPETLVLAAAGVASGPLLVALWLRSAVVARREQLLAELVPTIELLTLELSAGGSVMLALATVSGRTDGALAGELRRAVIGSQVAGSAALEDRLAELSESLDLLPLATLATIVAASREYGAAALPGFRALARDLRQRQRRRLIELSRRALNRVLVPAAVGVLLPFMAILLFPAVATLSGSLG